MLKVIHVSAFSMLEMFNCGYFHCGIGSKLKENEQIIIDSEGHTGLATIERITGNKVELTFKEIQRKIFIEPF